MTEARFQSTDWLRTFCDDCYRWYWRIVKFKAKRGGES